MRNENPNQPPMEPPAGVTDLQPVEVLAGVQAPPAHPPDTIEARLLLSIWRAIGDANGHVMPAVDVRDGFYTIHGPFGTHINEIFVLFDEFRGQLEFMRTNLIEAAREVAAGMRPLIDEMEPGYRGHRHGVPWSMCEEIDQTFDFLRNRIGYETERRLVSENESDDDVSLFSTVIESADVSESE
jgi:hypothetical protein